MELSQPLLATPLGQDGNTVTHVKTVASNTVLPALQTGLYVRSIDRQKVESNSEAAGPTNSTILP
jgi:hypothetical protein